MSTGDCEEFTAWSRLVGWDTDYKQLGKGNFSGWYEPCISPGLRIGHRYSSREMVVYGTPPSECVPLIIPLNQVDKGSFQGRTLGDDNALLMCPGSEAVYHSPAHLHILTVSIPASRLQATSEATTRSEARSLFEGSRSIRLSTPAIKRITCNTERIARITWGQGESACSEQALAELEEELVIDLCVALGESHEPIDGGGSRRKYSHYVRRAQEFIEANLGEALDLKTLARSTGVCERTLRYAFSHILGMPPVQYIKTRRLIAARDGLQQGAFQGATVTNVAQAFGFAHFGYFSQDYHNFFGECPSTTLKTYRSPR
jgi:AraC family ethanolamine operon transcriptional activator